VPREIIELRELVNDLKKDNEKLKADLEDIKKRLDAKEKEQTDNDEQ